MPTPGHQAFPNGCHACEVVVDPETGKVDIDRYTVVDDVGVIINPLICEGQIHGALAQGIGQALFENVEFERDSGQMLSASLWTTPCRARLTGQHRARFCRCALQDQSAAG